MTVGGGSDHMQKIGSLRSINPYNPFLGMWTTIVRQPRGADAPLHPEQTLTREQAIRLYTINNAFLTFEEAQKGSLEPGKLADFIVLDRDILTCPVDEVKDIKVEATYLGWLESVRSLELGFKTDLARRSRRVSRRGRRERQEERCRHTGCRTPAFGSLRPALERDPGPQNTNT